jgi:hypothetical protein
VRAAASRSRARRARAQALAAAKAALNGLTFNCAVCAFVRSFCARWQRLRGAQQRACDARARGALFPRRADTILQNTTWSPENITFGACTRHRQTDRRACTLLRMHAVALRAL